MIDPVTFPGINIFTTNQIFLCFGVGIRVLDKGHGADPDSSILELSWVLCAGVVLAITNNATWLNILSQGLVRGPDLVINQRCPKSHRVVAYWNLLHNSNAPIVLLPDKSGLHSNLRKIRYVSEGTLHRLAIDDFSKPDNLK